MTSSCSPSAFSLFAMSSTSSLSWSWVGLGASSARASGSSFDLARLTLALPSVNRTTMIRPTSPPCRACVPNLTASESPWASGEPPPHGSWSRRLLAMAMDLDGGRSISALSP